MKYPFCEIFICIVFLKKGFNPSALHSKDIKMSDVEVEPDQNDLVKGKAKNNESYISNFKSN